MYASIVVPAFNNIHLTLHCLRSLLLHTPDSTEIVVFDDHSDESQFSSFLQKLPRTSTYHKLEIHHSVANVGFSRACNTAAEFVRRKSDVIIFLNNDAFITDRWLEPLMTACRQEKTGIAGSLLLYPENKYSTIHHRNVGQNTIQHAGIIVGDDGMPRHYGQFESFEFDKAQITRTLPYVTGASLAMRKDIFETLSGFNVKYKNGCEDLDVCVRARKLDLDIVYCHRSVAYHHETATRNPEDAKKNLVLFIEEHKNQLHNDKTFSSKELAW